MPKKSAKTKKPSSKKPEPKARGQELSEKQLEQVAGGASTDYLLMIDGIKGETSDQKGTISTSTAYTPHMSKFFRP
jgi:hypothetical protein